MIKLSYWAFFVWVLGLLLILLNPIYVDSGFGDVIILGLTGMACAFPWYLITKWVEDVK